MEKIFKILPVQIIMAIAVVFMLPLSSIAEDSGLVNKARISQNYGKIPLQFEINQGQTDEQVKFMSRGSGYSMFLTPKEAVLVLTKAKKRLYVDESDNMNDPLTQPDLKIEHPKSAVLRMKLEGANPEPLAQGHDELPGKINYLIGNDPSKWRSDIATYKKVKFKDVYQGIDLVYYGTSQQQLEYDFVVAPGADPKDIALGFEGADRVEVDGDGNLVVHLPVQEDEEDSQVVFHKPLIYQEVEGVKKEVPGSYALKGSHKVGFQLAEYDTKKPLIIDPVLVYSTFLGGNYYDSAGGIATDGSGCVYVSGSTASYNFPTVNAFQANHHGGTYSWATYPSDVFVAKLNADGSALVYSTYIGGSGDDAGNYGSLSFHGGIAVDVSGNASVTGRTTSTDFPVLNPIQATIKGYTDAFVTKLDPTGSRLVYSTYLGGSSNENYSSGGGITVDTSGNAYVTGYTDSTDFPTLNPIQAVKKGYRDAFVTKLDPAGSLVYSTYLGGNGSDGGYVFASGSIAVDASGNAYVTGVTDSTDFPTVNPFQADLRGLANVFVTKFNSAGSGIIYSTYLGGSNGAASGRRVNIVVDASENAYIMAATSSTDFPTVNPFQANLRGYFDLFVAKFDSLGGIIYSTYLGGSGAENRSSGGIAVDISGNAYITGETTSTDFPIVDPFQATLRGGADSFVTILNPTGSGLVFSSYLGGSGGDLGFGIAVDTSNNAYIVGSTGSINFPIIDGAFQAVYNGTLDAYIVKVGVAVVISPPSSLLAIDTPCDNGGDITLTWILSPNDANKVTGYRIYRSTSSGGPYGLISNVGAGVGSYADTTATTGTTYFYVVRATDGTNESANSNKASAVSTRDLPFPPTNVTAADTSYDLGGSIFIDWVKSLDDGTGLNNVSGYNIYRYSATNGTILTLKTVPAGTANYIDNTTTDGETYKYYIKAISSGCNTESILSNTASGVSIRNLPLPPTNVTVIDTPCDNGGSTTLTWSKSFDDGAGLNNVIGYNVYRSTASSGPFGKIGNVVAGTISFVDGSAVSGTSYSYVVRATDGSNESSNSSSASAASARNLPLPPTSVTTIDTPYDLGGSITLAWTKSADDGTNLNNVLSYNIYRFSSASASVILLASVPAGTIGYADNATADIDTYYYFIKAIDNQCGMESPASTNTAYGQSINNFTAMPDFVSTLPGISAQTVNSLTSKVENAIASYESGNTAAAINKLNALLNEISAQVGKGIETTTAQTLTNYIQNLIAYINVH